jgi:hypothetical protein
MPRDISPDDPRDCSEKEARTADAGPGARFREPSRRLELNHATENFRSERGRVPVSSRRPEALDTPRAHDLGRRVYFLRATELQTLAEIGTFRAIAAADLASLSYGGDTQRMEREIRHLREQALVSEKTLRADRNRTIRVFALTKNGARLARKHPLLPEGQVLFHGHVKPREAKHDADLYRLYHAEAQRIAQSGGRVTRVVLDYELKRNLNRELASLAPEEQSREARERIAERHGLALVNGKIPVPDMRIEYDTAEMELKHLYLELATRNYRPRALAEKARAGFSFYALREDVSRLRRILDEREITAQIFAL